MFNLSGYVHLYKTDIHYNCFRRLFIFLDFRVFRQLEIAISVSLMRLHPKNRQKNICNTIA